MIKDDRIILLETVDELRELIVEQAMKISAGRKSEFEAELRDDFMKRGVVGYLKGIPVLFREPEKEESSDFFGGCGGCGGC